MAGQNNKPKLDAPEPDYTLDEPSNVRADLSSLGIDEVERGVCEDTFENRRVLRKAKLNWEPVYSNSGTLSGLIKVASAQARTERRLTSLAEKEPILEDRSNKNSDYLTGLHLIAEESKDWLVPPWVVAATRKYLKEQKEGGPASEKRQPAPMPHRCRIIKDDGIRCMLWGSGRPQDNGMCRIHLRSESKKSSDDIERARERLQQAAPHAVDQLENLMDSAESEPVKLKAATEILDRAGIRGGVELDANVTVEQRPAAEIIAERLERLQGGALSQAQSSLDNGADVVDAEIVEEEHSTESQEDESTVDSD